jgi:hypothetical protein
MVVDKIKTMKKILNFLKKLVATIVLPVIPLGPILCIFGPIVEKDPLLFWGVAAWWWLFFAITIAPIIWGEE